jgi:hypothetical protein
VKRKSIKEFLKESESETESPTKEKDLKEDGGTQKQNQNQKLLKETLVSEIKKEIDSFQHPKMFYRIIIDELNDNTKKIVDELWSTGVSFIVSGSDFDVLNRINFTVSNMSGSLGRWRVVHPSSLEAEPAELYISCKETNDSSFKSKLASKTIKYY